MNTVLEFGAEGYFVALPEHGVTVTLTERGTLNAAPKDCVTLSLRAELAAAKASLISMLTPDPLDEVRESIYAILGGWAEVWGDTPYPHSALHKELTGEGFTPDIARAGFACLSALGIIEHERRDKTTLWKLKEGEENGS